MRIRDFEAWHYFVLQFHFKFSEPNVALSSTIEIEFEMNLLQMNRIGVCLLHCLCFPNKEIAIQETANIAEKGRVGLQAASPLSETAATVRPSGRNAGHDVFGDE